MLTKEFLQDNPVFLRNFIIEDDPSIFFNALHDLAHSNIPLAHCISKCSAVRNDLTLSNHIPHNELAKTVFIGCYSTHKPYDSVGLSPSNTTLCGSKHFVTNLPVAEHATFQMKLQDKKYIVYVDLSKIEYLRFTYDTITGPGMIETQTGEIEFINYPFDQTSIIMEVRKDERWDLREAHNHLFFSTNFLGAAAGLFELLESPQKYHLRLEETTRHWRNIVSNCKTDIHSDDYWKAQNWIYIKTKRLLADLVCEVIQNYGGEFMGVNNSKGKFFYDCLVFSSHRGAYGKVKDRHMLAR